MQSCSSLTNTGWIIDLIVFLGLFQVGYLEIVQSNSSIDSKADESGMNEIERPSVFWLFLV